MVRRPERRRTFLRLIGVAERAGRDGQVSSDSQSGCCARRSCSAAGRCAAVGWPTALERSQREYARGRAPGSSGLPAGAGVHKMDARLVPNMNWQVAASFLAGWIEVPNCWCVFGCLQPAET
jgi:hypothetical protein